MPLVVLAFVVAGFAYYTLFTGPNTATLPAPDRVEQLAPPADPVDPNERTAFSGESSLASLLARGDSIECAITHIPNPLEAEITGNIFTNVGQLRGDFIVPTPDLAGQMVTSIIIAEDTIWQWTDIDGELVGSKQPANFDTPTLERLVPPVGFATIVQYDCLTWPRVDRTVFEAPTQILFTDVASASFEEGIIFLENEGEF